VKKLVKITSILFFVALYCLITGLYRGGSSSNPVNSKSNSSINIQEYFFFESLNTNDQVANNENAVSYSTPITTIKNHTSKFICSLFAIERIILNTFWQYSFDSHFLLIQFFQTDITFPFHYFW